MNNTHDLKRVDNINELYYIRKCGVVGSYGGGDDMMMSRTMFCVEHLEENVHLLLNDRLKNARLHSFVRNQVKQYDEVKNEDDLVAKLPKWDSVDWSAMSYSLKFQVSTYVYGIEPSMAWFNMMYHGWLYHDLDPNRLGKISYPLCGSFQPEHMYYKVNDDDDDDTQQYIGHECLKWADQHIHKVGDYYHFGSDMNRFRVDDDNNKTIASAWMVAVDLEQMNTELMLLWIVPPSYEADIETTLNDTTTTTTDALMNAITSSSSIKDITSEKQREQVQAFCSIVDMVL